MVKIAMPASPVALLKNVWQLALVVPANTFPLVSIRAASLLFIWNEIGTTLAAPETFDGWVSRFSDQYSLAIVYQELLTGVRPFSGSTMRQLVLQHFKKSGRGVLVYLRDGAAGVPVAPLGEPKTAEADRNRQWREVGVGAQILRDLGVTSIVNLTSSAHDYKGLSGFGIEIVANERFE